jgi:hypothetical protein
MRMVGPGDAPEIRMNADTGAEITHDVIDPNCRPSHDRGEQ